jgi:ATP-binding cassette subfamily C protein CydD
MRRRGEAGIEKRLLARSRASRVYLAIAVGAGTVASSAVVAQGWFLADVINRVFLERQGLEELLTPLVILLSLAILRAASIAGADYAAQRAATGLKGALRADLLRKLRTLGPAYSERSRSGELATLMGQGVEELDEYMASYQPARWLALVVPLIVALVVLALDPLSVFVLLLTGPALVLFLILIGSRAKELTDRRFRELNWMSAQFLDFLRGLATLKMFGRSGEQVESIRAISRGYGNTTLDVLRTAFETSFVLELSTTIATALVAVEIGLRLFHDNLAFQQALAVVIITPEFFAPLRHLAGRYHAGAAGRAAAERIFAILDTPSRPPAVRHQRLSTFKPPAGIVFHEVNFGYEGNDRLVLQDVSFTIESGQTVALIGETGAGKSTIASLLLRFFEPVGGSITVDGVPLASLEPASWRATLAWVPQRPHLFFGSVAENIRLARPDASDADVIAAAEAAGVARFIHGLPDGYNTQIGERGVRLSGGERQRIAIARAILKDSPVVILDEPTSHLDSTTEAAVQAALQHFLEGKTALLITHRLSLAAAAGKVVVLRNGSVETTTKRAPSRVPVSASAGWSPAS